MQGDEISKTDSTSSDSLAMAEKRLQAQMAMEGEERRKKREAKIAEEREAAENAKQIEEERRREIFNKAKQEEEKRAEDARRAEENKRTSADLNQQVNLVEAQGDSGLKTIRTMRIDEDSLIKGQNISLIGMAVRESERKRQREESGAARPRKSLALFATSLVLIAIGLGAGLYFYTFYYAAAPSEIISSSGTRQPILFADATRSLDVSGLSTDGLTAKIKNEVVNPPDLLLGAVEDFVLTRRDGTGASIAITTTDFFKSIGANIPDTLLRTLGSGYMFGILSSAENAGFIILKTESYDKGLAGLLDWEGKTMTKDLYQTLTALKPDADLLTKPFEDLLIRNIDTRVLKDKDGVARIVYGFLDNDKIIAIAGNRQAFIEAKNRFDTPRPMVR